MWHDPTETEAMGMQECGDSLSRRRDYYSCNTRGLMTEWKSMSESHGKQRKGMTGKADSRLARPAIPVSGEADAGGSQVPGHQGQTSETLSQKKNMNQGLKLAAKMCMTRVYFYTPCVPRDRRSVVLSGCESG